MSAATRRELRTTRFLDDRAEPTTYARPLFERVMREGARRAGLVFAVDAIDDASGCMVAVRAGAPNAVNDALAQTIAEMRESRVASSVYDVVIADVGTGRQPQSGLFNASRAAINIGLAQNPVLMRGGTLILPTSAADDNESEDADITSFYDALTNAATPDLVIQQLQGRSLSRGEERAYLLAHVMQRHRVIAAGAHRESLARASHFISAPNVRDAAELAESFAGRRPRSLIARDATRLIPTYSGPYWGNNDDRDLIDDELAELQFN